MDLMYEIKDEYRKILKNYFSNEEVLASVPANIDDNNDYSSDILVVTDKHIVVFYEDKNFDSYVINDGADYKCSVAVGNGLFEATFDGVQTSIVRYSMDHAARYASLAKGLNKHVKDGVTLCFEVTESENKCSNCGRVLRHGSSVCVHCLDKFSTFKRLIRLIDKKYYKAITLCVAVILFTSAISLVEPYLYRLLIDDIFVPQNKSYKLFAGIIITIIALKLVTTILDVIRGRKMADVNNSVTHELRMKLFDKIEKLSMSFINKKKTGDLMHRVTHDTNRIRRFLQHDVINLISQSILLITVLIILFTMSWEMAIIILLPAPIMVMVLYAFRTKTRSIFRVQWRLSSRADSILQDILSGMRIVKAFGKEKDEVKRYQKASRDFTDRVIYNESFWATLQPVLVFVMEIGTFLIYLYGGYKIIGRQFQVGEFVQFTQYAGLVYGPLRYMTTIPKSMSDAMAAGGRIFEILDEELEIYDKSDSVTFEIKGAVDINNVSFGYKSYLEVLNNINLHVKPGEMIGLVGHSGSGKSTLINLILRFYDVDNGSILIDGINIKDISQKDLRRQIGVVLQDTFLFSGTIRENIVFSKPNATDEEVIAAARIANAHDFITKFPDGYDTKIGERGQTLSGGEKQRVAIARAIIHDPKILILDEATSSLDTDTENSIQEALARLVKNRTTFAIAHRLATLKNADRLLVLEKGNLAEIGTHDELMEKKGIYYGLVMAQKEMSNMKGII